MDKEDNKKVDSVLAAPLKIMLHKKITSGICKSSANSIIILPSYPKLLAQIGNSHKPILYPFKTILEHKFLLSKLWLVSIISTPESFSLSVIFTTKGKNFVGMTWLILLLFSIFCKSFKHLIFSLHPTSLMDMNNLRICSLLLSHLLIFLRCIQMYSLSMVLIKPTTTTCCYVS